MTLQYVIARDNYKPSNKIEFLLIAESPPASGGFFYFDKTTGRDSLFRETMKALGLFPESSIMKKGFDKRPLLKNFQSCGFFLVDTCYEPVNKKSKNDRKRAIEAEIPRLIADVRILNPEGIIIVKSSLFDCVKSALEKAGFGEKILNERAIPFPSCGHQKEYREMLRLLILGKRK